MSFLPLLCFLGIIILVIVALGRFDSRNVKATQTTAEKKSTSGAGCGTWFLAFIGMIVSSLLLLYGGLLFLIVFLVMRMNPARDSQISMPPTDVEKKTAHRIYTWLFFSPLLTISCALTLRFGGFSDDIGLRSLTPLIFHIPLLLGITSKSQFVFRHTQQGILLIGLRAALAAFAFNNDALWLFLLGNGALWLFGTMWGRNQVIRGEYWWRKGKGETIGIARQVESLPAQRHIEESKAFIQRYKADEAKEHALAAFRSGNREIKLQAVHILDTLGEVEKF